MKATRVRGGGFASALLLAAVAACAGVARVQHDPGAPFTLSPQRLDLGRCFVGEARRVELTLTNHTPAPLALDVEVSCGCQDLELSGVPLGKDPNGRARATLAPGAQRLVMVVVPPRPGARQLWLRLAGAAHTAVGEFLVHGEDELVVAPAFIGLSDIAVGDTRSFAATVSSADGKPFTLTAAHITDGLHDVQLEPQAPGRVVVRGRATPTRRGAVSADVRLRTDRKFSDWVYVVVQWDIPEPCSAEPAALVFGVVRAGDAQRPKELVVITPIAGPEPSCTVSVTPPGALVQVGEPRTEVIGARRRSRFYFALSSGAAAGPLRGHVAVCAGEHAIAVPVSGLVAKE